MRIIDGKTGEESEHCCDEKEHVESSAQSHGIFTAVKHARRKERYSAHGKHHEERSEVYEKQFAEIEVGTNVYNRKAYNACESRTYEHCKQRGYEKHGLSENHFPALCAG